MKPVCVPCERFMRPKKNGFIFMEGWQGTEPGKRDPESWKPYKLWAGDLWECPDCHAQTIVGVGARAITEHFNPEFNEIARRSGATLLVKDC